jgi:hypothetical protein
LDPADVFESAKASFLVRAAAGQYDLGDADNLPRLLARMARNKVAQAARVTTA